MRNYRGENKNYTTSDEITMTYVENLTYKYIFVMLTT